MLSEHTDQQSVHSSSPVMSTSTSFIDWCTVNSELQIQKTLYNLSHDTLTTTSFNLNDFACIIAFLIKNTNPRNLSLASAQCSVEHFVHEH